MIIAHVSDTHHHPEIVTSVGDMSCDVIVITGDVLANMGREVGGRIDPEMERLYQENWFETQVEAWVRAFAGRPVVSVPGNHDFISIEKWLVRFGHHNVHTISSDTPSVTVCGKVFAGFREVPWIDGEWMGETQDLQHLIERTMSCNPDIIVTHAPPAGILDGTRGYGVRGWTMPLFYGQHSVTHHLFGHAHSCGGQVVSEGGIVFSNAACHLNILSVP